MVDDRRHVGQVAAGPLPIGMQMRRVHLTLGLKYT
jgi:hypothetical protein